MLRLVALVLLAVALAACGGDDESEVEDVVRAYAEAINDRDADRFCNDLITAEYAQGLSVETDEDRARDSCEKLFGATQQGLEVEILEITAVKVDGDNATARVRVRATGTGSGRQVFKLEKEDGEFRVTNAGGP